MRVPFSILGRIFLVRPYTTKQEKEVLLLQQLQQKDLEYCIDETLRIFNYELDNEIKLSELHLKEKKMLLYLYRGVSVGDECSLKYTCSECGGVSSNKIIFNFLDNIKDYPGIRLQDYQLTDDNMNEFIQPDYLASFGVYDIDDLDLTDYEVITNNIKNTQKSFNFNKNLTCSHCRVTSVLDCSSEQFILDHMSEENLMMIYDGITTLVSLGYSKSDVEELIPFERTVLMDQMVEELRKRSES